MKLNLTYFVRGPIITVRNFRATSYLCGAETCHLLCLLTQCSWAAVIGASEPTASFSHSFHNLRILTITSYYS